MCERRRNPAPGGRVGTRKRRPPGPTLLDLTFCELFLRLNRAERQRVAEELGQPFRRQWFIVDEHGVRKLE